MKYIQFFKDKNGKYLKKNYLYVDGDNKITIKGLPLIKDGRTEISKFIFNKYLKDDILSNLNCKFEVSRIKHWVEKETKNDMSIVAREIKVKMAKEYTTNTIQKQISNAYLDGKGGRIKLIKNTRVGRVGKGSKYCTIDEAKANNLKMIELDLEKVWNELNPFIKVKSVQKRLV